MTMNDFEEELAHLIPNWAYICHKPLTEGLIRHYHKFMVWNQVCQHSRLSEDLMWEFRDEIGKIGWRVAGTYQKFTNLFILKCEQYVDWDTVLYYQDCDELFIREHCHKITNQQDWRMLLLSKNVSNSFVLEYHKNIFFETDDRFSRLIYERNLFYEIMNKRGLDVQYESRLDELISSR